MPKGRPPLCFICADCDLRHVRATHFCNYHEKPICAMHASHCKEDGHTSTELCNLCFKPMGSTIVNTPQGVMHEHCDARAYPYLPKKTFREVLNSEDQVTVRSLLEAYVPASVAVAIVERFNLIRAEAQKLREVDTNA